MKLITVKTLPNGITICVYRFVALLEVRAFDINGKVIDGKDTWYDDKVFDIVSAMESKYSK